MKELRDQAKSSAKAKLARITGGYDPDSKSDAKAKPFVKRSAPAEKSVGDVKGDKAKPRMDRPGFKRGGRVKGSTNVNVIIASKPDAQAVPVTVPTGGPSPMPPGPPPMAPPGAGAGGPPIPPRPGMPMRKRGGRVKVPDGGKVKMTAGSYSGEGRLQKARPAKRAR